MKDNKYYREDHMNSEIAAQEDTLDRITDIVSYVDRMIIWFRKKPALNEDKLGKLCKGLKPDHVGWKSWIDSKTGERRFNYYWQYKLEILQPSKKALSYLREKTDCSYRISFVEIALDHIGETFGDVRAIRTFFDTCWIKKWHGKQKIIRTGGDGYFDDPYYDANQGVTYYCKRRSAVNYVIYSDRPSKKAERPCCHLEVRLNGSTAIKRAKLDKFSAYLRRDFDHVFWKKHLDLRSIKDTAYIEEKIMKTLRKKKPHGNHEVLLSIIMRWFKLGGGIYKAQNFVDHGKWVNAKIRFLTVIPNQPFLPPKG